MDHNCQFAVANKIDSFNANFNLKNAIRMRNQQMLVSIMNMICGLTEITNESSVTVLLTELEFIWDSYTHAFEEQEAFLVGIHADLLSKLTDEWVNMYDLYMSAKIHVANTLTKFIDLYGPTKNVAQSLSNTISSNCLPYVNDKSIDDETEFHDRFNDSVAITIKTTDDLQLQFNSCPRLIVQFHESKMRTCENVYLSVDHHKSQGNVSTKLRLVNIDPSDICMKVDVNNSRRIKCSVQLEHFNAFVERDRFTCTISTYLNEIHRMKHLSFKHLDREALFWYRPKIANIESSSVSFLILLMTPFFHNLIDWITHTNTNDVSFVPFKLITSLVDLNFTERSLCAHDDELRSICWWLILTKNRLSKFSAGVFVYSGAKCEVFSLINQIIHRFDVHFGIDLEQFYIHIRMDKFIATCVFIALCKTPIHCIVLQCFNRKYS